MQSIAMSYSIGVTAFVLFAQFPVKVKTAFCERVYNQKSYDDVVNFLLKVLSFFG